MDFPLFQPDGRGGKTAPPPEAIDSEVSQDTESAAEPALREGCQL